MQREENKNVTHPLKKRRARGSLVVIWHLGYFVGKYKVLEQETTRSLCWHGKKGMLVSFLLETLRSRLSVLHIRPRPNPNRVPSYDDEVP